MFDFLTRFLPFRRLLVEQDFFDELQHAAERLFVEVVHANLDSLVLQLRQGHLRDTFHVLHQLGQALVRQLLHLCDEVHFHVERHLVGLSRALLVVVSVACCGTLLALFLVVPASCTCCGCTIPSLVAAYSDVLGLCGGALSQSTLSSLD